MIELSHGFHIGNQEAKEITLRNREGMIVKLLNYGAAILEILVPDKDGQCENIVLTHEYMEDYIKNPSYFGVTVGRTSGRIAQGMFTLDGERYFLEKNFGIHHGHGGRRGFSHRLWDYFIEEEGGSSRVIFQYESRDMEEGYPGNLKGEVTYTLMAKNELLIEYGAISDKNTLCNLTNHSYFNLSGDNKRKITDQILCIRSKSFLELDENLIPTGKSIPVQNTPMDFREPKKIGEVIACTHEQLKRAGGYDHPWLLEDRENQIEMIDRNSGRKLSISTTYPSVVIYSYNFPNQERLKSGRRGSKFDGICFETQYEPDGIHHRSFHSAVLNPGKAYYEKTLLKFSIV